MNWEKFFCFLSMLIFFFPLSGKTEDKILTLSQAVNLALQKNPVLKAADYSVEVAKAQVGSTRSGLLPRLDFYEGFSRTNNPMLAVGSKLNQENFSAQDYELKELNHPAPISNFNARLIFTQPIFDQGKTWIGIRQAKIAKQATEQERERVKQEIIFAVINAYFQTLRAKEELKLASDSEKTASAHVKLAEDLFQTGQVVKSDLLSAQVRLSEVKEMVIQAENNLKVAKATLNKAMGTNQEEDFSPEVVYSTPVDEQFEIRQLIEESYKNRPDFLAMEDQIKNGREVVRMAKTNFLPSFKFIGQYDLNDCNKLWGEEGESWMIAGVFQFNLFEGFNSRYKLKEAQGLLKQLISQKEEHRAKVELEVRQAFHQLKEAKERLKVTGEAITQAEESLRIIEDRYRAGLARMVEVLDGEVSLTRAKRNHLYALCDLQVARAQLDFARGTLFSPGDAKNQQLSIP
ncbi:MAG: TolC family protein [Desulfobacterota bacterium]|nr:TolC family protein [Thermodesulfobacteriota bacterium]